MPHSLPGGENCLLLYMAYPLDMIGAWYTSYSNLLLKLHGEGMDRRKNSCHFSSGYSVQCNNAALLIYINVN